MVLTLATRNFFRGYATVSLNANEGHLFRSDLSQIEIPDYALTMISLIPQLEVLNGGRYCNFLVTLLLVFDEVPYLLTADVIQVCKVCLIGFCGTHNTCLSPLSARNTCSLE